MQRCNNRQRLKANLAGGAPVSLQETSLSYTYQPENQHFVIIVGNKSIARSRSIVISSKYPRKDTHQIELQTHQMTHLIFITNILMFLSLHSSTIIHCTSVSRNISNLDSYCEAIQPMLVKKRSNQDSLIEELFLIDGCPDELDIVLPSSYNDGYVINLVKNKGLIGDEYFNIINSRVDNLQTPINQYQDLSTNMPLTNRSSRETDENFYKTHKFIPLHKFNSNDDHCHYQGVVYDKSNSIAAISVVKDKLLSGIMYADAILYHLIADETQSCTFLKRVSLSDPSPNDLSLCLNTSSSSRNRIRRDTGTSSYNGSIKRRRFLKSNPENKILHQPFLSNSSSLYVELLVVHDHSQYIDNNGNTSLIAERTMQIVNIMNAFYRQLNIFIALVGVVLWTEKDEIKLTDDGDSTLTNFLKYRYDKLLTRYHHDNAQLITSTSFNGSVVGKALKGPICTYDHSGGVNTDHSHNPAIVAVTLAHELGHNLGMEHDEDEKCKCPDEKCIMSSSSSFVHPKHWSSCSVEYLEDSRKHGLLECLRNEPRQIFGPICGNGFIEEGEDCDIGEPMPSYGTSKSRLNKNSIRSSSGMIDSNSVTRNPCCDRTTCKFTANSTCAQGPCCDLTKCSVFSSNDAKICRPRMTKCDLEEICDGASEYCPPDVYYHDGLECGPTTNSAEVQLSASIDTPNNRSRAYCYNGECSSHESQCQLLWGPTGAASRDICYEQNIHGNTSGSCGYNRRDKTFESCDIEHAACGMLHCVHNQVNAEDPNRKTGKLNYGFESASILTVSFFVMSNHAKIYCHGAIIDAGPNMRDPGLVPNGAACGDERMCLNQKCVLVHEILNQNWCPSDCNGNGICDNQGVCHCDDGTVGTSCYQFFSANFHLSLLLYIVMFFGPIIALIVLAINHYRNQIKIWWFLHNRKIALRSKSREPAYQRRLAYDANGRKVSISEPIPLNRQIGANGSFFDPSIDPWAESSHQTGKKSLGYRLEPLKKKQLPPPPPLPDYQNGLANAQQFIPPENSIKQAIEDLKPIRSAPPPPIPPHKHETN